MEKITLNGKRYIALGDLERLRHNLIRDIYDKYEKDENGQIHLSPEDMGWTGALHHLMVCVMEEEYKECAPDRKKCNEMHDAMRREQFIGKWCIVGSDPETKETVYFRKWCPYIAKDEDDDGEDTPVLSSLRRDAKLYGDYYKAMLDCENVKKKFCKMDFAIRPGYYVSGDAERRLLDAIFGSVDGDEGEWCIFLEPDGENEKGMWFSEWLKYREDLPDTLKEACEKMGMKEGTSAPMFVDECGQCMIFKHKGMAEKQVEKIIEQYPDWKDKLHVMAYEDVSAE